MFKHPSGAKFRPCMYDPGKQLIRGIIIESLGYPNLNFMKGAPKQVQENPSYYIVRTLKAGK